MSEVDKKKSKPAVSVIIPTYNRADSIEMAVKSVLNQTYKDFELIIVDDGSTDNTEEVINNIGSDKIRYIKMEKNSGAPAARNRAIKEAAADLIMFQDSDDEWLPEKMEMHKKVFDESPPEVGVVYAGYWHIMGEKKIYKPDREIATKEGDVHKELLLHNFLPMHSMVRKSILEKIEGFDEKMPRLQDWELWIRVSNHCKFAYIDKALHKAYFTNDSISANNEKLIRARKLLLEKYANEINADKNLKAHHYFRLAHALLSGGRPKEAREYINKALKLKTGGLKQYLILFSSYLGTGFYNFLRKVNQSIK